MQATILGGRIGGRGVVSVQETETEFPKFLNFREEVASSHARRIADNICMEAKTKLLMVGKSFVDVFGDEVERGLYFTLPSDQRL